MPNREEALQKYASHATHYDATEDRVGPMRRAAVAKLELEPGRPVGQALDVGCGTGQSTMAIRAIAHHVVGVDPSESMLAACGPRPNLQFSAFRVDVQEALLACESAARAP